MLEKIPVLVYTDIKEDIDDALALTYIAGSPALKIAGVIATHKIPLERYQLASWLLKSLEVDAPIAPGSREPLRQDLSNSDFEVNDPRLSRVEDIICRAFEMYDCRLVVLSIAPTRDLARSILKFPDLFGRVERIFIQGSVELQDGVVVPSQSAYNFEEDMVAAKIVIESQTAKTILSKHAASQVPLTKDDFWLFAHAKNQVGPYFWRGVRECIGEYIRRDPVRFERVFGARPASDLESTIQQLPFLSKPYDALTAMAIDHPGLFRERGVGGVKVIGWSQDEHGILDPSLTRSYLISTILNGLNASSRPMYHSR